MAAVTSPGKDRMSTVTIVTIIVIAFLVVFISIGWSKGFLRTILTTLSLVVTLVVAAFLLTPVSDYLTEHTGLEKAIEAKVEKGLGWNAQKTEKESEEKAASSYDLAKIIALLHSYGIDVPEDADADQLADLLETMQDSGQIDDRQVAELEAGLLGELKLPQILKNTLIKKNTLSDYIRLGVENFKQYVVRSISMVALKIATYIALVIAIYIIIRILLLLTKVIEHIPVIRGINRFFGAIVGFIEGALILWIICLFISLISNTEFGGQIVDLIRQSAFLSYIYEENLVLRMVHAFFTLF